MEDGLDGPRFEKFRVVFSSTFTLDRMILESSISGTPMKCSPTM